MCIDVNEGVWKSCVAVFHHCCNTHYSMKGLQFCFWEKSTSVTVCVCVCVNTHGLGSQEATCVPYTKH